MRALLRSPSLRIALLALLAAFAFLGSRGIWEPDEGRYSNVALNMLDSGDWIDLQRNDETGHWAKPPLTYWAIAGSIAAFGQNAWAARLPSALAYLLCAWLAWRIGRRLAPGAQQQPALVYATMVLPFTASQLVTTDYLLAACLGVAMLGFVEARFGASLHPRRWMALLWLGLALGFLTKGPPALVPLLVLLVFDLLSPGKRRPLLFDPMGLALFALMALPWYVVVINAHPGLLRYFLGNEVVARVASDQFDRHGQWYGWLQIYAPTLLVGSLPWTAALLRWTHALPASLRRWHDRQLRDDDAPALLLALWVLLPLLVFCLARSRLPLYLLPTFLSLAILAARQRHAEGRGLPRWPWLAAWLVLLLALKLAGMHWPTQNDARAWAEQIRARTSEPTHEVVFVDDRPVYGIHLHLGAEVEKVSLASIPQTRPGFNPEYDSDLVHELAENESGVVWIAPRAQWPQLQATLAVHGEHAMALGPPYADRVIFVVRGDDAKATLPRMAERGD